jgi:peptidoglycan/xylan/chitin deacetylase (PgdA/CDA1 family)
MKTYIAKLSNLVKSTLIYLSHPLPFQIFKKTIEGIPIGIFYRVVSDEKLPHIKNIYAYRNNKKFEEDILFLKDNFRILSYSEIFDYTKNEKSLPKYSAFISFDDGLKEAFINVRSILRKHRIPCTFFLTTDLIDNKNMLFTHKLSVCIEKLKDCNKILLEKVFNIIKNKIKSIPKNNVSALNYIRNLPFNDTEIINSIAEILGVDFLEYLKLKKPYLTSEQINILISEGFEIGAHEKSHIRLSNLPSKSAIEEIEYPLNYLKQKFNKQKIGFSFPFSSRGFDNRLLSFCLKQDYLFFESSGVGLRNNFINRIGCDFSTFNEAHKIDFM